MLKSIRFALPELGFEDSTLSGFRLDLLSHALTLDILGAYHVSPAVMSAFQLDQGPGAFAAELRFGGVASIRCAWNAEGVNLGHGVIGPIRALVELPRDGATPERQNQPTQETTALFGGIEGFNALSTGSEVRAFALLTSGGVNAEWTATDVEAWLRGPAIA